MNSNDCSKNHPQSLLSDSTEPSGAGSTITNTHLSHDRPSRKLDSTTSDDSKPGTEASTDPNNGKQISKGRGEVAIGDKGHEAEAQELKLIKEEPEASMPSTNQQIELLEHVPDAGVDEGQDWAQDTDHEMKRVKVSKFLQSSDDRVLVTESYQLGIRTNRRSLDRPGHCFLFRPVSRGHWRSFINRAI